MSIAPFFKIYYHGLAFQMSSRKNTVVAKRKASTVSDGVIKKAKTASVVPDEEKYSIVDRKFYPPEMTNDRCHQYIENVLPRPIELLDNALKETASDRKKIKVKDAVVHWFKCDLRIQDNKALHLASEKAKSKNVPLICIFMVSPQDYQAHMTSPVRVDFILRTLQILKEDLARLDIPLHVETIEKRKKMPGRIFELCEEWGVGHLFANVEYEVDELRREAGMIREGVGKGIDITVVPDTCVVSPGELSTGTGRQYAVYSPWFRAWTAYLHAHPDQLDLYDKPAKEPIKRPYRLQAFIREPNPRCPGKQAPHGRGEEAFSEHVATRRTRSPRKITKVLEAEGK